MMMMIDAKTYHVHLTEFCYARFIWRNFPTAYLWPNMDPFPYCKRVNCIFPDFSVYLL